MPAYRIRTYYRPAPGHAGSVQRWSVLDAETGKLAAEDATGFHSRADAEAWAAVREPANMAHCGVRDTDPAHSCKGHDPETDGTRASWARCGTCSGRWCATCHPTPASLCPYCNGAWDRPKVDPERLNDAMEMGHVVQVHDDGTLSEPVGVYAPECYWNEWGEGQHVEPGSGWVLLTGYSGQHGYPGPIMHESEYIGGRMARDILARPGLYVAVVCDDLSDMSDDDDAESTPAGWAVAYRETPED